MIITNITLPNTLSKVINLTNAESAENMHMYLHKTYKTEHKEIITVENFGPIEVRYTFSGLDFKNLNAVIMIYINSEYLSKEQYRNILHNNFFASKLQIILKNYIDQLNDEIKFLHPNNISFRYTSSYEWLLYLGSSLIPPNFERFMIDDIDSYIMHSELMEHSNVY